MLIGVVVMIFDGAIVLVGVACIVFVDGAVFVVGAIVIWGAVVSVVVARLLDSRILNSLMDSLMCAV